MKDEDIKKFLNKNVKVIFKDNTEYKGYLKEGIINYGNKWIGKGYHLERYEDGALCFKKSYIKKIEIIY